MGRLYSSPLRVYLCLGALALLGLVSAFSLPVSLFPNSNKPEIDVRIPYGSATAQEFLDRSGGALENQLRSISTGSFHVDKLQAYYHTDSVRYKVEFQWQDSPQEAQEAVRNIVDSAVAGMSDEVRNHIDIWGQNDNSGFLALSFYSRQRSLTQLYDLLEPVLVPKVSKVKDADKPVLWNPEQQEVSIELNPEKMASLQLFPNNITQALDNALHGYAGGSLRLGTQHISIEMPRYLSSVKRLNSIPIPTPAGKVVQLGDVAQVNFGPSTNTRSFKTSGAPSLIFFAQPKPGGNVNQMSDQILEIVKESLVSLPKDVQYKVLVDPSSFIRASINNVLREVCIGALLAVLVLFIFIGSFRNIVTAAIEIPLSMILAFILMKLSHMNLNLISLGGLALSAGMNVDGSVVVMENIFRHFEEWRKKGNAVPDFKTRLQILCRAVSEVRFAVIASTIASVVVFLPLAFTSDLSYAILGDLAKTVVFSHSFSAVVALVLVPTVRLQLMSYEGKKTSFKPPKSPIESWIKKLEEIYGRALQVFVCSSKLKWLSYGGLFASLFLLVGFVLPRLPRELIGRPDTDWMYMHVETKGNSVFGQMESNAGELEARMLDKFGKEIRYTFTQINSPNSATVMARLKDKTHMQKLWKAFEKTFPNTPLSHFYIGPWNPAELPIPNPPQMRIAILGGSVEKRRQYANQIENLLEAQQVFPRLRSEPDASRNEIISIKPNLDLWPSLRREGAQFMPQDLADLARVATDGKMIGQVSIKHQDTNVYLRYPSGQIKTPSDIGSLAIGVGKKLLPLRALAQISMEQAPSSNYREDGQDLFLVLGKKNEGDSTTKTANALRKAKTLVHQWELKQNKNIQMAGIMPSIHFEDAEVELHQALHQLEIAIGISILLILFTLIVQFGNLMNALLVLMAVPLGFIGVLLSLFLFHSNLSLNSALGVILLNGIAVANSIILVDFMKRLVDEGMPPSLAAVTAGEKRLRPILITSLTTILGMLPIAFGLGEGGRILQPLGIAVSGGLWVSMALTLFVVPALQVSYLEWRSKRSSKNKLVALSAYENTKRRAAQS